MRIRNLLRYRRSPTASPVAPQIAHSTLSLDFIKSESLRKDERFLQFLAFGMIIDPDRTRSAVGRYVAAKEAACPSLPDIAWPMLAPPDCFEVISRTLDAIVQDCLTDANLARPLTMGLSGGLDSRLLFHFFRKHSRRPITFTFQRANDDAVVRALASHIQEENHIFLEEQPWRLEDFYDAFARESDLGFLNRAAAGIVLDRMYPDRLEIHGFLGDALAGNRLDRERSPDWQTALGRFAQGNNPFGFQKLFSALSLLPGSPLADPDELDIDLQTNLGFRQENRIKPPRNPDDKRYLLPFADPRWIGLWLNRPREDLVGQSLYVAFIRSLDAPEFFDLPGYSSSTKRGIKKERQKRYPPVRRLPPALFAETAIERLRRRNVFAPAFLDRAAADDASRFNRLGLIATEIAIGAGRFA
jgi:hypothetical protein